MKYIKLLCVFCMMFLPVMVFAQGQIKRSSTTRTPPPSSNTVRRSSSTSAAKEKSINKKQSVSVKSKTKDIHDYVDLGLPSGTLWATCNVGASKPEGYGNYYAWGETATKTVYEWSTYKRDSGNLLTKYTGSSSAELELADDAAYVNWGSSWRMPTKKQQDELRDKCTWTWTTLDGVNGRLVTGPNGNTIFLPAAGERSDNKLRNGGDFGYYWSCELYFYTDGSDLAQALHFYSVHFDTGWDLRNYGLTVRAVRVPQN